VEYVVECVVEYVVEYVVENEWVGSSGIVAE
jgi:hypothetical protein